MSFYSHAQIPRYKGQGKKTSGQKSGDKVTRMRADEKSSLCVGGPPASLGSKLFFKTLLSY